MAAPGPEPSERFRVTDPRAGAWLRSVQGRRGSGGRSIAGSPSGHGGVTVFRSPLSPGAGSLAVSEEPMRFEKTVTSISDLTTALSATRPMLGHPRWFRGQANAAWRLEPSLARPPASISKEAALIKRFRQNAITLISGEPHGDWAWLFLMQHHGLPTRLLDWSENPLIALYFATSSHREGAAVCEAQVAGPAGAAVTCSVAPQGGDQKHTVSFMAEATGQHSVVVSLKTPPEVDGALWVLDPVALNAHARLDFKPPDFPAFGDDDVLNPYLPNNVIGSTTDLFPAAAIARRAFPRLVAQAGVFTIVHKNSYPLDTLEDGEFVGRFTIPAKNKQAIREELRLLGISRLALFPELPSVAEAAKEVL